MNKHGNNDYKNFNDKKLIILGTHGHLPGPFEQKMAYELLQERLHKMWVWCLVVYELGTCTGQTRPVMQPISIHLAMQ